MTITNLKQVLRQEWKVIAASLSIGLIFAISVAAYTYVYAHTTQRSIANSVIRFHVLANSNRTQDQDLKDEVRIEVLAEFKEFLQKSSSLEVTRDTLTSKLPSIQQHAEYIVRRAGFNYHVTATLTETFFPTTVYGNIAFPPGIYEAVQIIIGEGVGDNWWCLMFPPLCYVDMTATETSRNHLQNNVPEEGFRLLTHQESPTPTLTVRFRVVEWWQNRRQPSPNNRHDIIAA